MRRPDALTATGEAQARAAGALLRELHLRPALAVHTKTIRTRETTRLALEGLDVPTLVVSGGASRLAGLERRAIEWERLQRGPGPLLLCAHHTTQRMLCSAFAVQVPTFHRALFELEVGLGPARLLRLFTCEESGFVWQTGPVRCAMN